MKNLTIGFIALAILILAGLGCSNTDDKPANTSATNTTSNAGGNSNDGKSNSNKTTSTDSKDSGDVAGSYSITGKNPSGQAYQGDLTIKKQEAVYQFTWSVAGSAYDGVGVRDGNLIAVGYGGGDNGKGCGAAIYRIGDKMLEGKLGGWGYNQVGTQTAILLKESKNGDIYTVTGVDTDGSDYKGELYTTISKTAVYHFAFSGGKIKYVGTGIKVDNYFGAGIGVKECGYAVYEVKEGKLESAWGIIGNDKLGTEIATRR